MKFSGGQAQRVAIARAMVIEPRILFADEPTGSLDSLNSEKVMELFIKTAKDNGTTVIMVTYEPTIAAYADREVIVRDGVISSGGAGRVSQPRSHTAATVTDVKGKQYEY